MSIKDFFGNLFDDSDEQYEEYYESEVDDNDDVFVGGVYGDFEVIGIENDGTNKHYGAKCQICEETWIFDNASDVLYGECPECNSEKSEYLDGGITCTKCGYYTGGLNYLYDEEAQCEQCGENLDFDNFSYDYTGEKAERIRLKMFYKHGF